MRSFESIFWLLFVIIYILIGLGSYYNLKSLFLPQHKKKFSFVFIVVSLTILLFSLGMYVWPGNIRSAENYSIYTFLNGILSSDFLLRSTLSLSLLLSLIFKRYQTIVRWTGVILATGLGLNLAFGILQGRKNVELRAVHLSYNNLPKSFHGYTILQLSDIHLGNSFSPSLLNKVKLSIDEADPDLIVFTGDLVNNYASETKDWAEAFTALTKNIQSFSILGNHDYGNYSSWSDSEKKMQNFLGILQAHKDFGFTLLNNESTPLTQEGDTIYLVGVENWGHPPFPQYANLDKALKDIPAEAFKVVLSHDPAHWEEQLYQTPGIHLTLSGHTHGLQWGIKPGGIPFSLSFLTRKNWSGLYQNKSNYLYVNQGLGTIGVPWRIDMPAEITLITLESL